MIQLARLFIKRKLYIYFPLIIYWIVLFIATSIPGRSLPEFGVSDKFKHFGAYFILTVLLNLTFAAQQKFSFLKEYSIHFAILISAVYGIVDEVHQSFIPGRSCDVFDWISDVLGASLCILVYKFWIKPNMNKQ